MQGKSAITTLLRQVRRRSIPRSLLCRQCNPYCHVKTLLFSQHTGIWSNNGSKESGHQHQQKSFSFTKLSAFGILTFATFYGYKKRDLFFNALEAADKERASSSRRNTYNFIAEVVESGGSAVVYIERLGRIPFSRQKVPISHGSGFIVESDGLIITNAHVVGNQSKLKVRLQDGREYEGEVLGVDEGLDLAAVKIQSKHLPHLTLGCSSEIRPGEWVVAMGSPLNLKNTVTAGIVSNIHRAGKELGLQDNEKRDMEYIQTDAMINVGNSGGPLVNLDVEVIGVNSMMASAGIGFAIPVDYVKDFLQRLKRALDGRRGSREESMVRPGRRRYIGITMLTLTEDIVDQLILRDPTFPHVRRGVLVHRVQPNSPADKAGLLDGDVIVSISGREIISTKDVFQALRMTHPIEMTVRRGDKSINLRVVPEDVM